MAKKQTRESRLVKRVSQRGEVRTPVATEMYLPNHSGNVKEPALGGDLVPKSYVDAAVSGISADRLTAANNETYTFSHDGSDGTITNSLGGLTYVLGDPWKVEVDGKASIRLRNTTQVDFEIVDGISSTSQKFVITPNTGVLDRMSLRADDGLSGVTDLDLSCDELRIFASGGMNLFDNEITGVDFISFNDVNGTIAGIENQNLLDKSANEEVSGNFTFNNAVQLDDGTINSDVADAADNDCFLLNTLNSQTGGGATGADLRSLLTVQENGTDRMQLYADGYLQLNSTSQNQGGIWMGLDPTTSAVGVNRNRIEHTITNTNHASNVFRVGCVKNMLSVPSNKTASGFTFTLSDVSSADQSGGLTCFSADVRLQSGAARNQTGTVLGMDVSAGWGGGTTPAINAAGGAGLLRLRYSDSGAVGSAGVYSIMRMIEFNEVSGATGYNSVNNFTVMHVRKDFTSIGSQGMNPATMHVLHVAPQSTNGAAAKGNIYMEGGNWNSGHFRLENGHLWNDATNNVLRVNGAAPTAETDGLPLPLAYGHMYTNSTIAVTIASANTPTEIGDTWTTGAMHICTFGSSHYIVAVEAGTYKIDWSMSIAQNSPSASIQCEQGIMIDGTASVLGRAHRTIANSADVGASAGNAIITLTANQQVSLYVENQTNSTNIDVEHANLSIMRMK